VVLAKTIVPGLLIGAIACGSSDADIPRATRRWQRDWQGWEFLFCLVAERRFRERPAIGGADFNETNTSKAIALP